jgi:hypothetical protein
LSSRLERGAHEKIPASTCDLGRAARRPDHRRTSHSRRPRIGAYSWNACRDPWRLGADAITAPDSAALTQVRKMNTWIKTTTGGDPSKISSGYKLNGTKTESGEHPCFTAPFAVAAMTDPGSQAWLDKLFTQITNFSPDANDYYGTGITLQVLLILSGNFIAP